MYIYIYIYIINYYFYISCCPTLCNWMVQCNSDILGFLMWLYRLSTNMHCKLLGIVQTLESKIKYEPPFDADGQMAAPDPGWTEPQQIQKGWTTSQQKWKDIRTKPCGVFSVLQKTLLYNLADHRHCSSNRFRSWCLISISSCCAAHANLFCAKCMRDRATQTERAYSTDKPRKGVLVP